MNDVWCEIFFGFNNVFLGDFLVLVNLMLRMLYFGKLVDCLWCLEFIKLFCILLILDNVW